MNSPGSECEQMNGDALKMQRNLLAGLSRSKAPFRHGRYRDRLLFAHDLRANATRLSQGKPLYTFPDHALRRRDREQARDAPAADVVDAREHDVVALDLDHHGRGEALAVELAERHGEVGGVAVPADGEIGTERDLRRALRAAHRDFPFAALRRHLLPL